jgi:hypothetical protein
MAFEEENRAPMRVEFAAELPAEGLLQGATDGVRCVQKNTFIHIEADQSPAGRRPRSKSDVTNLRSTSRAERFGEDPASDAPSTVDEESPRGLRSRLESVEEWPVGIGSETPEFLRQNEGLPAPPAFVLPAAAAEVAEPLDMRRRQGKKETQARRADVTLMLRNIPNKYTQDVLLEELAVHLQSMDFFYLPIDFRNQCNLGYAFLNFKDGAAAQSFQATFDGNRLARFPQSPKVLQVHMARVQGLQANVKRLRNSTVMGMLTEDCKPVLFDGGEMKPLAHSQPQGVSRRARTRGQAR